MKESERILLEIQSPEVEENDWKFWHLQTKLEGARKQEYFEETQLHKIKESWKVRSVQQYPAGFYKITFLDGLILDYYPKKNKGCQVSNRNTWVKNALAFILKRI